MWFLENQLLADLENNKMFSDDLECQKLLMEAMKYHLLPERRPMFQSPRTKPRKSTVGSLYAVGGMDSTKGATHRCQLQQVSVHSNTIYSNCNICCVCAFRLHHHREVRPTDQHLGPGWSHEWTPAAVWCGSDRKQVVRGRRKRWTQDVQHGGVLQSGQQRVVHHAPDVNTQTRAWWVSVFQTVSPRVVLKRLIMQL